VEEAIRVKIAGPDGKAVPQRLIAMDGVTTGRMDVVEAVDLYPGYRADVLIQAPDKPGEYVVFDDEQPSALSLVGLKKDRKTLARIKVAGASKPMALPRESELAPLAPYRSIADGEVTGQQKVHFGAQAPSPYPFSINGHSFDPGAAPRKLTLGGVDEWTLTSEKGAGHIFHIHINPFEVVDPEGKRYWKDTLFVTAGGTARVRTRYERYVGKYVIHCHILPHEDLGMMEEVEVSPKTEAHPHH